MVQIERFERLELDPEFFHLPRHVNGLDTVEYYLIRATTPAAAQQCEWWDILAVGTNVSKPYELILRQLHIEEERLEWDGFNGWIDSSGVQSFNPPELHAVHIFLRTLANRLPDPDSEIHDHPYFVSASASAYAACGIPQGLLDRFSFRFLNVDVYRYQPAPTVTVEDACSFLRISHWTPAEHPIGSTLFVRLETYSAARVVEMQQQWATYLRNQLRHPSLDVRMMDGESTLCFSRGALLALADLLEACLERAMRGTTP